MFSNTRAKAHIIASSCSLPEHRYTQKELADTVCGFIDAHQLEFQQASIQSLFENAEIDTRYFSFPVDNFNQGEKLGGTVEGAIEACVHHSEINVRRLLSETGLNAKDISQVVSVTLTPAVPTMCARLMNRIAFSPSLKRMPLAGLGCMAGAAAISRAADYLEDHPTQAIIVISCELSSALWQGSVQRDLIHQINALKHDPSQHHEVVMSIVTAALFGDGSGGLVMVGRDHPLASQAVLTVYDNRSNWIPDTEHIMGLDVIDDGIRNILRPEVKTYVGTGLRDVIVPLLDKHQLTTQDVEEWTLHPGGPRIMDAAETAFKLSKEKMQGSRDALRNVGNISSATVLYMLDNVIRNKRPRKGSTGLVVAMGPGFSQEAVLVGWH